MRNILIWLILLGIAMTVNAEASEPHGKFRLPFQVEIVPVSGKLSGQIKPGDVVEFNVIGHAFTDLEHLTVSIELLGGAKLVSGNTSWSGTLKQGGETVIHITVQAPEHGIGKIRARISLPPSSAASFSAESEFLLGADLKHKPVALPQPKRDSNKREIREYGAD